jgi:hypothetical protein
VSTKSRSISHIVYSDIFSGIAQHGVCRHKEDIDMFCLSLLGKFLAMMHLIDAVLDSFSNLFRFLRYPL